MTRRITKMAKMFSPEGRREKYFLSTLSQLEFHPPVLGQPEKI
jgi:hypothetical protein